MSSPLVAWLSNSRDMFYLIRFLLLCVPAMVVKGDRDGFVHFHVTARRFLGEMEARAARGERLNGEWTFVS